MKQCKNAGVFPKNGFTLIELMIVIVVIGILAAVSMPKFMQAADKTKAAEAPLILNSIVGGQEAHRLGFGNYLPLTTAGGRNSGDTANWYILGLKFPDVRYFDYIADADASDFGEPADPTNLLDFGVSPTFTARASLIRNLSKAAIGEEITINNIGIKNASVELRRLVPSFFEEQP